MSKKFLSLFLTLVTLLAAAAPTRVSAARELTDEDDREARGLALSFVKRLREADDFGPPVSEFFPEDFEQRVKQFIRDAPPDDAEQGFPIPCDRALLLRAEAGELRRLYVAMMNFWSQLDLMRHAAWDYAVVEYRTEGRDATDEHAEAWARHTELAKKAVPDEAFRVAESDPLLNIAFGLVRDDYSDAGAGAGGEENLEEDTAKFKAMSIHDAARLRSFVEKLERCVALMREGVAKLRSDAKSLAAAHAVKGDAAAADKDDLKVYYVDSHTLEAAAFGVPSGAILIQARIFPFELAMTRVEGRLRILAVYPDFDGD
jgi:hypothetical protein